MKDYQISINQLAEFNDATDYTKRKIIERQLDPDPLRISWYQLPKARIKKSIELKGDLNPVYDGISTLMNRNPIKERQKIDKRVSLEALERFVKMKLPSILDEVDYEVIKPKIKSTYIKGVEVIIAPEVIVKGNLNGNPIYGAVKIHISKNKPFDLQKSRLVASAMVTYLKNEIAEKDSEVIPEMCFSLDVFSGRIISVTDDDYPIYSRVDEICDEVKRLWSKV